VSGTTTTTRRATAPSPRRGRHARYIRGTAFQPRSELELDALPDDAVARYIDDARRAGDVRAVRTAVAVLVHGYRPLIAWKAQGRVPLEISIDDFVATVIENALRSTWSGSGVPSFRAWLNRIIEARVIDSYRHAGRRPRLAPLPPTDGALGELFDAHAPSPEEQLFWSVTAKSLIRALSLSDRDAAVLWLHAVEDLTADEILRALPEISSSANVYKVLQRVRDGAARLGWSLAL
jgi:DNA-directed RNA polymerase specialized sigma24 family protein